MLVLAAYRSRALRPCHPVDASRADSASHIRTEAGGAIRLSDSRFLFSQRRRQDRDDDRVGRTPPRLGGEHHARPAVLLPPTRLKSRPGSSAGSPVSSRSWADGGHADVSRRPDLVRPPCRYARRRGLASDPADVAGLHCLRNRWLPVPERLIARRRVHRLRGGEAADETGRCGCAGRVAHAGLLRTRERTRPDSASAGGGLRRPHFC